ncbi:MAG: serine/threonine-protein phosphatase [Phycisphaerales bacterium]|nr:serine/threonine-protein phosphatase [Phycisphaerales bacterium]
MTETQANTVYEQLRAKTLRKRTLWYCAAAWLLIGFGLLSTLDEFNQFSGNQLLSVYVELFGDAMLLSLFLAAAVYSWKRERTLRERVRIIQLLTVAACVVIAAVELLSARLEVLTKPENELVFSRTTMLAWSGPAGVAITLFVGACIVALSLREQVFMVLAAWGAYAISTVLLSEDRTVLMMWKIGWFPVVALPAMLLSVWRFSAFHARHKARAMAWTYNELTDELAYARKIHEALFPEAGGTGAVGMSYAYSPMRQIGGDFLFRHAARVGGADGPVSIALIDVTGHGVPAALTVNRLHDEMRRFFRHKPEGTPGELMKELNAFVYDALSPQGVFATAICARIDPSRRALLIAGAGHPPALLVRGNGAMVELHSGAAMLGVLPSEDFDPVEASLFMDTRDRLLAFTDGATEARDPDGRMLGIEGVKAATAVLSASEREAGKLPTALMESVSRFHLGRITDDTLIVEMWINESPETRGTGEPAVGS